MERVGRVLFILIIVLNGFLAVTAFGGGIGILSGAAAPPASHLEGSLFRDYTVPGLSLIVIVGGVALLATVLLIRRDSFAVITAMAAGIIIMIFEFVEVLVIGSPPGMAFALQLFYFALGLLIVAAAMSLLLMDPWHRTG